jgi:hypothetical protein
MVVGHHTTSLKDALIACIVDCELCVKECCKCGPEREEACCCCLDNISVCTMLLRLCHCESALLEKGCELCIASCSACIAGCEQHKESDCCGGCAASCKKVIDECRAVID